ncbi:MAG: peptidylprolyl isomerase [Dehalococcoidia bacterium]
MRKLLPTMILVGLVLLAACGQSDTTANGETAPEPTATPAPPTPTAEPSPTPTPAPMPTPTAGAAEEVRRAVDGDRVAVHYIGMLDSGQVFDTSRDQSPLIFVVGGGRIIQGFNDAVKGLSVGQTVTVRLEGDEAYGERRDEFIVDIPLDLVDRLILEVSRNQVPPEELVPGQQVTMADGRPAVVLEVTEEEIVVDANHRLAGQALIFEIELISIE